MRVFVVLCFSLLLPCSLLASPSSSTESASLLDLPPFDDSSTYEVSGKTLNEWLQASQAQYEALKKADLACANAEAHSEMALKAANESLTSFAAYRRSIAWARVLEVAVAAAVGAGVACALGAFK